MIIASLGLKGGSGKSTVAANLASELSALGRTVRILDADPQRSLVHISALGEGFLSHVVEPVDAEHPAQFRRAVEIASRAADRTIIDCPPGFADPALLAALVSDIVLIPCGPGPMDVLASREALEMAQEARRERGGRKPAIRFVPNYVRATSLSRDLAETLEEMGAKVLPAIGLRAVVPECGLVGLTVGEYAQNSTAADEFRALAKAVEAIKT